MNETNTVDEVAHLRKLLTELQNKHETLQISHELLYRASNEARSALEKLVGVSQGLTTPPLTRLVGDAQGMIERRNHDITVLKEEVRNLRNEVDFYKEREKSICKALGGVADGGQYRNDIIDAINAKDREIAKLVACLRDETDSNNERVNTVLRPYNKETT